MDSGLPIPVKSYGIEHAIPKVLENDCASWVLATHHNVNGAAKVILDAMTACPQQFRGLRRDFLHGQRFRLAKKHTHPCALAWFDASKVRRAVVRGLR